MGVMYPITSKTSASTSLRQFTILSKMLLLTRMHSSRMRTSRSLTVCCSLLLGGLPGPGGSPWSGGVLLGQWGVLLGNGGLPDLGGGVLLALGGQPSLGGVCLVWGGLPGPEGSPWSRGCLPGPRGGSPETPWDQADTPWDQADTPRTREKPPGPGRHPPMNRITDSCKNITLATTSLWPVNMVLQTKNSGYSQIDKIGNNGNICIRGFTT